MCYVPVRKPKLRELIADEIKSWIKPTLITAAIVIPIYILSRFAGHLMGLL